MRSPSESENHLMKPETGGPETSFQYCMFAKNGCESEFGGGLKVSTRKILKKSLRNVFRGILVLDTALKNSNLDLPLLCHRISDK